MPLYRLPNIACFITFRVCFNARFYYPIFALLFLDFGLTLSQFSISNLIWAATIVCLEVPSGALADTLGRKKLVVLASIFMILEMVVLLIAEPKPGPLLLLAFGLNRFLSGAGEAMASGADEALAYDSIKEVGYEDRWAQVLEWQTRLSSMAFFLVMLVGAAVYDPDVLNGLGTWLGHTWHLTQADTLKLPIWLTLGNGVIAFLAALSMKPAQSELAQTTAHERERPFQRVKQVGQDLLKRHHVLAVILATLLFDQGARAGLTMSSKTFSAYGVPEVWFGVIGASFALLGALIAGFSRKLVETKSKSFVFWLLAFMSLLGLLGQASFHTAIGLLFVACLSMVMSMVGFFASFYLNQLSSSQERATLLSFKGLACNLGFGVVSLYYSGVTGIWESESGPAYLRSLYSLPLYFLACLACFLLWNFLRKETASEEVAQD